MAYLMRMITQRKRVSNEELSHQSIECTLPCSSQLQGCIDLLSPGDENDWQPREGPKSESQETRRATLSNLKRAQKGIKGFLHSITRPMCTLGGYAGICRTALSAIESIPTPAIAWTKCLRRLEDSNGQEKEVTIRLLQLFQASQNTQKWTEPGSCLLLVWRASHNEHLEAMKVCF
jgi:hypothetical protein